MKTKVLSLMMVVIIYMMSFSSCNIKAKLRAQDIDLHSSDLLMVVEKEGHYYIYEYNGKSNLLYQSNGNPYKAESADCLINCQLKNGNIKKLGTIQADVTHLTNAKNNTTVYYGYKLAIG